MRIRIILPSFLISCLLGNPVALAQQLLSLQDLDALVRRHIIADVSGKFHQRGWLAGIEERQSMVMGEVSSETLNNVAVRNLFQASLTEVVRYDDASQDLLNDLINELAQYGSGSIRGNERNTAIYALNLEFDLRQYFFLDYYFADLEFWDIKNSAGSRMIIDGWVLTRIGYLSVLIITSLLSAFLFWESYRLQAGWTLAMNARQSGRPLKGLATLEKLHWYSGLPSVVKLKQQLLMQAGRNAMNEMETAISQCKNQSDEKCIYELLAKVDDVIMQLEDNDLFRLSLQNRRDTVTSTMRCPLQVELVGGPWGTLKLTREESLLLGRAASSNIVVCHERVSKEQLEVIYQNNGFAILDLTSSNGTLVNGLLLEPSRPWAIPEQGEKVAMGGTKNPEQGGSCRYLFQTTQEQPRSLLIGVDPDLRRHPQLETGVSLWKSFEQDARVFHLMIRGKVQLTANEYKPVILSKMDVSEACVMLEPTDSGYNLVPTGDIVVKINKARIRQSTPLLADAVFEAGDLTCKLVIAKTNESGDVA